MLDPKDAIGSQPVGTCDSSGACRGLTLEALADVVRLHNAAFPDSLLTAFGPQWVAKYYRWHMVGPHAVVTLGIDCGGGLAGFSVLLKRNGLKPFYHRYFFAILWQFLRSPRLIIRRGLRRRAYVCAKSFFQKSDASEGRPGTIRILSIAVDPVYQGQGLGQALLQASAEAAVAHGASQLALTVRPDNARAIRAYERAGWQKVSVNGAWRGTMRKNLAAGETA